MNYAGDAVLADFDTVTGALSCATSIQIELTDRNRALPDTHKVEFRIGINLGEVIVDRNDIYGDGVNVAARLEAMADPGGICISESVRTAAGKKLDLHYGDLGEQRAKNISEPVHCYKVALEPGNAELISLLDSVSLDLHGQPSIAVLPFTNMSGDAEQDYFSDGITQDIITALARFRSLLVIAINSSFSYKGQIINIQDVGATLGVQYVLEGSVRRSGKQVRVTAQLVVTEGCTHLWAERYDRALDDVFAVQDELTETIVATLTDRLESVNQRRALKKDGKDISTYDLILRGRHYAKLGSQEDTEKAYRCFEEAIRRESGNAAAYTGLGVAYAAESQSPWTMKLLPVKDSSSLEPLFEGLRKSGLPE